MGNLVAMITTEGSYRKTIAMLIASSVLQQGKHTVTSFKDASISLIGKLLKGFS